MIIAGAGLLLFITLLVFILSIIFSGPNIRPGVARIAALHAEIARVAELGIESNESRRSTIVLGTNVRAASLTSASQLALWGNENVSPGITSSTLNSLENEDIDAALARASESNQYNEVFEETITTLLQEANNEIADRLPEYADYPNLEFILTQASSMNIELLDSISSE